MKQGMSYEDYLLLLLISQKDKRQKYFRMMDLMEQNIRRKVSDFKLDQCISSYKITQNHEVEKTRIWWNDLAIRNIYKILKCIDM